jgi:type I restriction enzyme S subunit
MSKQVALSDLVEVNPRTPLAGKTLPFLGMEDVSEDGKILRFRTRSVQDATSGLSVFREGDVLFAKITPCMENGKGAYVTGLGGGEVGLGSTEFHVLRARRGADSRFVFHWLQSQMLRRAAENMMTGSAGQRRVTSLFFQRFKVAKFTLEEQRRIARILDAVDVEIAASESLIRKKRATLDSCIMSLFQGRSGAVWETPMLEDLLGSGGGVQIGPFGSQLHSHEYVSEGVPVVMPQDMGKHGILAANIARISIGKARELAKHRLERGDVLVARRGDLSRCVTATQVNEGWICGTGCLRVRIGKGLIMPEWLALAYGEVFCQRQIRAMAVGTTMSNINSAIIRGLRIPLPSLDEQRRLISMLNAQRQALDAEEATVKRLSRVKRGLVEDLLTGRVRV